MATWNDIAAVLERNDGVVSRADLAAAGASKRMLERWVGERRLERVAPRVWRVVGSQESWRQQLRVGVLALGPMAWVSHEAAAQLHGLDRTPPDRVEFLVLRNRRNRTLTLDASVHATRRWGPVDGVMIDGIAVTSATRTVLDLANARAHPERIAAAIDSAVRLGLSSPEAIRLRLDAIRSRGRTGVRHVEHLLEDAGGHTMLERKFLKLMRTAGLPRPETQVVISREVDGRFIGRVDFFYRDHGVIVEVSGRVGHSSPEERARDAQRRNELLSLGLLVYEFTWEDVTQRPVFVVTQMRDALRNTA